AALKDYGMNVTIYDPWAKPEEVFHEYGLTCYTELPENIDRCHSDPPKAEKEPLSAAQQESSHCEEGGTADEANSFAKQKPTTSHHHITPSSHQFDAVVLGVAHKEFLNLDLDLNL